MDANRPNRHRVTLSAVIAACLCAVSGCSSDSPPPPLSEPAPTVRATQDQMAVFDSAYCRAARGWAAHELDGSADGAYADGGPKALEAWWNEQLAYLAGAVETAPAGVRDAEVLNEGDIRGRLTPILVKYGFDLDRFDKTASAADRKLAEQAPRAVAKAQQARAEFQNRECGYGGSPPPADVKFDPSPEAKAYCRAARSQDRGLGKVLASGFDPDAFRAFATSASFLGALDAEEATAPAEIAADVRADNAWVRDHKLVVLEQFGYDLRRLLLEGTADQLRAFSYWDPAIIEQDRRVEAYVSQVCGMA